MKAKAAGTVVLCAAEDGGARSSTGQGTYIRLLLPWLQARFARVIVVLLPYANTDTVAARGRDTLVVPFPTLDPRTSRLSRRHRPGLEVVRRAIGREVVSLVIGNDWHTTLFAEALRLDAPLVYVPHQLWSLVALFGYEGPRASRLLAKLAPADLAIVEAEKRLLASADVVLHVSAFMQEHAARVLGVRARNAAVVEPWVPPATLAKRRFRRRIREVAFVGRLAPQKGIASVLEELPEVMDAIAPARLSFFGDGPLRPFVEWLTRKYGDRVVLHGNVPHRRLIASLPPLDFAFMPSIYESFGYVAREIVAARVPMAVADVGGLSPLVRALPPALGLRIEAGQHPCYTSPSRVGNVVAAGELVRAMTFAQRHAGELGAFAQKAQVETAPKARFERFCAEMDRALGVDP